MSTPQRVRKKWDLRFILIISHSHEMTTLYGSQKHSNYANKSGASVPLVGGWMQHAWPMRVSRRRSSQTLHWYRNGKTSCSWQRRFAHWLILLMRDGGFWATKKGGELLATKSRNFGCFGVIEGRVVATDESSTEKIRPHDAYNDLLIQEYCLRAYAVV